MSFKKWPGRKNKFGAKKTVVDGITFHSKREAEYYGQLKMLSRTGAFIFQRQVSFPLSAAGLDKETQTYPVVAKHIVDFLITDKSGNQEVHEVKGMETDIWRLKKKIFEANYPHIKYVVIK